MSRTLHTRLPEIEPLRVAAMRMGHREVAFRFHVNCKTKIRKKLK